MRSGNRSKSQALARRLPGPGVAKPERGKHIDSGRIAASVGDGNSNRDIVDIFLGILNLHIEVSAVLEDACVEQFELGLLTIAPRVLLDQLRIRKRLVRVLVQILHIGMSRRGVEIEVILFHVLAVISFGTGQAEQPLFQDGVITVPESQREAEMLMVIAYPSYAVFVPSYALERE